MRRRLSVICVLLALLGSPVSAERFWFMDDPGKATLPYGSTREDFLALRSTLSNLFPDLELHWDRRHSAILIRGNPRTILSIRSWVERAKESVLSPFRR